MCIFISKIAKSKVKMQRNDIFMDSYFTSFRLLTHLGFCNIRATGALNKNWLCKCTVIWGKAAAKKGTWPIWIARTKQKSSATLIRTMRAVYIVTLFVRCCNKVERKYIQEQQSNQIHYYSQNLGFVNRMDQSVTKYRIGIQMKKWWWCTFVWIVDVFLLGVWV